MNEEEDPVEMEAGKTIFVEKKEEKDDDHNFDLKKSWCSREGCLLVFAFFTGSLAEEASGANQIIKFDSQSHFSVRCIF